MSLNVKSSRCASISMIIFGFFILGAASAFVAFSLIFFRKGFLLIWLLAMRSTGGNFILSISWYLGYPFLLGIMTMITGCIGMCASSYRYQRDMCQIVTLFIFSMLVAGLSAYTIFNFSVFFSWGSTPTLFILGGGSVLGLAILAFLLSFWAMICCLASFCCDNEVMPEPLPFPQGQPPITHQTMVTGQQGVMMQGAVMVPMMRTNTVPVLQCTNPTMMQTDPTLLKAVPVMQTSQVPYEMQAQAFPMQVVASPSAVGRDPETVV